MPSAANHGTSGAHFLGGYYWIQGAFLENRPLLPQRFWSLSDCLCKIFPGTEALSWAKGDKDTQRHFREALSLSEREAEKLRAWVDARFNEGAIGWPSVFLSLDVAHQFGRLYLQDVPNLKLVATGLPQSNVLALVEDGVGDASQGQSGVEAQLLKRLALPKEGWRRRGYEILGHDHGGFHSFACNGLEEDYKDKLGIKLNAEGLIESLQEAALATDYTGRDDVGAEPGLWLPWLMLEAVAT